MLRLNGNAVEWNMMEKLMTWPVKMSINCENICVSMLIKGYPLQKKSHLNQITYFVSVSKHPSSTISMLLLCVHKQRNFSVSC